MKKDHLPDAQLEASLGAHFELNMFISSRWSGAGIYGELNQVVVTEDLFLGGGVQYLFHFLNQMVVELYAGGYAMTLLKGDDTNKWWPGIATGLFIAWDPAPEMDTPTIIDYPAGIFIEGRYSFHGPREYNITIGFRLNIAVMILFCGQRAF